MPFQLDLREISLTLWAGLAVLAILAYRGTRSSALGVLRSLLSPPLLAIVGASGAYVAGQVWLLNRLGLWESAVLFETVTWFVLSAMVLVVRSVTSYEGVSLQELAESQFRLVVAIEFMIGLLVFPIWGEFLLAPLILLVGTANAATGSGSEEPRAPSPGEISVGVILTVFAIGLAAVGEGSGRVTALSFAVPVILSLSFLPMVFAWVVYSKYEWLFGKLRGPWQYRAWARLKLIGMLGLRPTRILYFGRKYAFDLPGVTSTESFRRMLTSPSWRQRQDAAIGDPTVST